MMRAGVAALICAGWAACCWTVGTAIQVQQEHRACASRSVASMKVQRRHAAPGSTIVVRSWGAGGALALVFTALESTAAGTSAIGVLVLESTAGGAALARW